MQPRTSEPSAVLQPSRGVLRARYRRVMLFFARAAVELIWWDVILRRLGLRALARRTAPARLGRAARRYRALAVALGGVWIKVGQFLSSRVDVLPESITAELAGLQDDVPAEPTERMVAVVEAEFGRPAEACFPWFDPQPLASASLGQAHRARLPNGETVVVKVQRPGIEQIIRVDLAALQRAVGWLKRWRTITRRADLDALLQEFSRTLWAELDYVAEGEHARAFGSMFAADPGVRIPAVYGEHTTTRVLTLEDVYFIKITDYAAVEAAGVNRSEVASRLFRTYLRQIFVEGYFHADPHPGNLFVEPRGTDGWRLVFVDFGMVGRLSQEAKAGLRDLAVAVGTRDIDRLLRGYQSLGVLLPGANLDRIRQAEEVIFDRFWGRSMREMIEIHPREMRAFAREFRDVLYEMPFQVPSDLIFLGRCIAILSGMCTGLDPDFNVFEGMAPFARQLIRAERGGWLDRLLDSLVEQGGAWAALGARVDSTLAKVEGGDLRVVARAAPELDRSLTRLTRAINRLVAAVMFAVFLLVSSLLYVNGEQVLGAVGLLLALLAALWVSRR
jgi:predicted unusual protein kinase regulating ubiquinone biosynthesis (AarF/ABC1/UbiB family)